MTIQRIQWTCPICKRRYAIPATAPTPSRCPQCRQAEEEAAAGEPDVPVLAEAGSDEDEKFETAALSALAAIQLEVAEEAARGPTVAAPVMRRNERMSGILPVVAIIYTVLAGLAVVGAFAGLLFGLHAAFAMPATARAHGRDFPGHRGVWRRTDLGPDVLYIPRVDPHSARYRRKYTVQIIPLGSPRPIEWWNQLAGACRT